MRRLFCLFALCLAPLIAQVGKAQDAPTMNPAPAATSSASPSSKSSPLGGFAKDRPKNAKTEITAKEFATFDNATSIANFQGSVVVKDPQFNLFCDKLKVTLNKDHKGLEKVEAVGHVIITQESKDDSGKTVQSVGRSGMAVYVPATGDITLTDWPSVQHDINLQTATEQSTVMVLNRDGKSHTTGASKTTIVETGNQQQNY